MVKVAIKSEKLSPFGGFFSIMEQFDSNLSSVIGSTLGMRCRLYGYQYSEIIRSLMSVYFCGGSCIEDVTTHLMYHLSLHPTLRTCSADTILRAIKELTREGLLHPVVVAHALHFRQGSPRQEHSPLPDGHQPSDRTQLISKLLIYTKQPYALLFQFFSLLTIHTARKISSAEPTFTTSSTTIPIITDTNVATTGCK